MESEVRETVACPHCGGTIKAAARRCKHCRSDIEAPGSGGARPPSAPTNAEATEVAQDLRALLVSRGVLSSAAFDALGAQHPGVDASALLGRLCDAGHITALQIEFHREAFRERQLARLDALLSGAVARALLGASHAQAARAGFEPVVFEQTPKQFLVAAHYVTTAQVRELDDRAIQQSDARAPGGTATPPVISRRDLGAWWRSLTPEVHQAIVGISLLVALVGALLAARGSPDIVESATMNGWGHGTATFTNRGRLAGSVCGHVIVRCGHGSRSSATFCSGSVAPNETKRLEFTVTEMDRIASYGRDWRDDCDFDFVRETTGN